MSGARERRLTKLNWTPRVKGGVARTAKASASASALTADVALANMKMIGRRRAAGCAMDQSCVAAIVGAAPGRPVATGTRSRRRPGGKSTIAMVALLGIGAVVIGGGLLIGRALGAGGYKVEGQLVFQGTPVGNTLLCFHAGDTSVSCMSATTSSDGRFAVSGLSEGKYKVTVRSLGESDGFIPAVYARADSTRFALSVTADLSGITMLIEPR